VKRYFPRQIRVLAVVVAVVVGIAGAPLLPAVTAGAFEVTRSVPMPSMAIGGSIETASCVSGPVCVALGWNHHGNTSYYWLARWQDQAWTKLPNPLKGISVGGSDPAISCASSTWCMTTGADGLSIGNHPVADELVGTQWTSLPVPTPRGSTDFSLFKLDCRSSTWCVAVGSYVANEPNYTDATFLVSEVWNGSTWRIVPIYSPRTYAPQVDPGMVAGGEHPTAAPQQLSCTSTTFCVVAGFWAGVFVEEWNGHRWSQMHAPNEPHSGTGSSEFSGGTCVSATFCVATGGYDVANGVWRPLVEQWNGQQWRIATLPGLPKFFQRHNGFRLTQVECASTDNCLAFGNAQFPTSGVNALKWNGHSWSYAAVGNMTTPVFACLTSKDCYLGY
jgi:hypothetical protein